MAAVTFTARDCVTKALQALGAVAIGEAPSNDLGQMGLDLLNGFIDGLLTQRLSLPAQSRDVYSFVANQSTYTIGPSGADWTASRPVSVDYVSVLNRTVSPPFEIPLDALSQQSYAAVTLKTLTANFPFQYFWNPTFPNGSIFFWPTPTDSSNYQAVLYTPSQLSTFASLNTSTTMAPGYYRMLYYNLAVELQPFSGAPGIPAAVAMAAEKSLLDIKRVNLQMYDLITPGALPGTDGIYNIYGDVNY